MIRYLKYNEIDKKKWDECIHYAFNGNAYAYSWYLDIVHPYWEALVQDNYERVMPLTRNKKWGINYLLTPYFVQQLGVFSKPILNPQIIGDFLKKIPTHFRFAEYNLNAYNLPDENFFELLPNKNYLLDLINDYKKTARKYSTNTKRNLKKALTHELTLSKSVKPEELTQLFRENKGHEVKHWKTKHYLRLQHLMYMSIHKGKGVIYGVFTSYNELCATAFFLKENRKLIFLFSGSNQMARQNHAMTFLFDSVIKQFSSSQFILDFEGSNNENLARFYKGFGAHEIIYYQFKMNRLPFPLSYFLKLFKG